MKLLLIRHGQAERESVNSEKELTTEGIAQSKRVAKYISESCIDINIIYTSPLKRAFQTAEIFHQVLGLSNKIITDQKLAPGSITDYLLELCFSNVGDNFAIVGHLPDLVNHVSSLTSNSGLRIEFMPSAAACIDFHENNFNAGCLQFLLPP